MKYVRIALFALSSSLSIHAMQIPTIDPAFLQKLEDEIATAKSNHPLKDVLLKIDQTEAQEEHIKQLVHQTKLNTERRANKLTFQRQRKFFKNIKKEKTRIEAELDGTCLTLFSELSGLEGMNPGSISGEQIGLIIQVRLCAQLQETLEQYAHWTEDPDVLEYLKGYNESLESLK